MILTPLALDAQDDPEQNTQASPAQQAQEQAADRPPPWTVWPPASDWEHTVEADWNEPKCGRTKSHNEADLCEQRRMAKAAEDAVFWSRVQVGIALVGTLFLMWNLFYARRATDAAVEATRINRETLIADQRAWIITPCLSIEGDFEFSDEGCGVHVALIIRNIGKSPALYVHTLIEMTFTNDDVDAAVEELCRKNLPRDIKISRVVLPGESYTREWNVSSDRAEIERFKFGDFVAPVIFGSVRYEVLNDKRPRQTAFAFLLSEGQDAKFSGLIRVGSKVLQQNIIAEVTSGGFAD